jgi:hypothetical protein
MPTNDYMYLHTGTIAPLLFLLGFWEIIFNVPQPSILVHVKTSIPNTSEEIPEVYGAPAKHSAANP